MKIERSWNNVDREAKREADAIRRLPSTPYRGSCKSKCFEDRIPVKGGSRKRGLTKKDLATKGGGSPKRSRKGKPAYNHPVIRVFSIGVPMQDNE